MLLAAAAVALVSAGLLIAGAWMGLLYLLPALVLAGLLVSGRFPGEELLVRAATRRRRRTRAAPGVPHRRTRASFALIPRGGRLLAAALAGRAPPGVPVPRQAT